MQQVCASLLTCPMAVGLALSTVQNRTPCSFPAFWGYLRLSLICQLALLDKMPGPSGKEAQKTEFTLYKIGALCLSFHAGC